MTEAVKKWIQENIKIVDDGDYTYFIEKAHKEMNYKDFVEFLMFLDTNEFFDTTTPKLEAFANRLIDEINYYRTNTQTKYEDPSNSWSRLQWCIGSIGQFNLKYVQIVDYLIQNKSKLGIKMIPLPIEYGWDGADDYDLGWFDKDTYYQLHSAEINGDY